MENKKRKSNPSSGAFEYNPDERISAEEVLGDHPALKYPDKKKKFDQFTERYYPLIDKAAQRVLNKLGLADKEKRGEIDRSMLHMAGTHALFQAVNDYNHDHPSQAKFTTHLNQKMQGLMQAALKAHDEIPDELREGAKKFDKQRRAANASPVKHTNKEGVTTMIYPGGKPPEPAAAPKRSSAEIAANHPPEVQDRLKRIVAAKGPIVRKQGALQPKPAVPAKKWNVRDISGSGEEE
jgi:hypothetical protein